MPLLSTVTIALNQAISGSFTIKYSNELERLTIKMPAAWTPADLKAQYSLDNGNTWEDIRDDAGDLYKITGIQTAVPSAYSPPLDVNRHDTWARILNSLSPVSFRLVSIDTADETNENQLAARTIRIYANYSKSQVRY